jgi:ribosomal protein S18 acetylase RimI-like enzyme
MFTIQTADITEIPIIQNLAEKTWWPTYQSLLSEEQLTYMLDTIYSIKTLTEVIQNNSQTFIILRDVHGPQGFASYGPRPENPGVFKLHKLYVMPNNHGNGYGTKLVEEVKDRVKTNGISVLDLNVKRDNPAKGFYEKLGFRIIGEEDIHFGPYLLQDFVMRLDNF